MFKMVEGRGEAPFNIPRETGRASEANRVPGRVILSVHLMVGLENWVLRLAQQKTIRQPILGDHHSPLSVDNFVRSTIRTYKSGFFSSSKAYHFLLQQHEPKQKEQSLVQWSEWFTYRTSSICRSTALLLAPPSALRSLPTRLKVFVTVLSTGAPSPRRCLRTFTSGRDLHLTTRLTILPVEESAKVKVSIDAAQSELWSLVVVGVWSELAITIPVFVALTTRLK
jgi:hypothetical protein